MIDIAKILLHKYPETKWVLNGNDYSGLEWLDDSPKPSQKELEDQWSEVQQEFEFDAVKQARHNAYVAPGGSDALFLKWQRGEATKQEWLDAVQAINDAHPYHTK
jgi:hypothetical protein